MLAIFTRKTYLQLTLKLLIKMERVEEKLNETTVIMFCLYTIVSAML
jgi:hypothetical protein